MPDNMISTLIGFIGTILGAIIGAFATIKAAQVTSSQQGDAALRRIMLIGVLALAGLLVIVVISLSLVPRTPDYTAQDLQAARQVIDTEVKGANERNLPLIESLYAPNATIIDRKNDKTYKGLDGVRESYRIFFERSQWKIYYLVGLSVEVFGNKATGTHRGVVADGKYIEDHVTYSLEKMNGRWMITKFEVGIP